ncbi:MAG TPA: relaxase/mobilization nuclease domain-containing protein [Firmicutes bacterium]|nr:relaxase/mobilization nuclease domain-containing protein [Bacillota bacterium]
MPSDGYTTCVNLPISTCSRPKRDRSFTIMVLISPFSAMCSTHLNTDNLHNHFVVNSVSFKTDRKFPRILIPKAGNA